MLVGGTTTQPILRRIWAFNKVVSRAANGATVVDAHFALYAFIPAVFGKLRTLPLIVHFQGPWAEESRVNQSEPAWVVRAKWLIEYLVYRKAAQLVVLSTAFKRVLVEHYRIRPWRINVIAPGVDLDRFSTGDRGAAREAFGLSKNHKVVVVVRRLVARMGLDTLLNAWAEVQKHSPDAVLMVVGVGPQEVDLRELAETLGVTQTTRFLGRLADDQLVDAYRSADVAVVPTLSLEGFGLVVLEAMACGTPVIATRVGGLPEMLRPFDSDLLVPPGDAAALSSRITAALAGDIPSSVQCRKFAERYGWHSAARANLNVYRAAISPSTPKTRIVFVDHCAAISGGELAMLRIILAMPKVDAHVILAEDGPFMDRLVDAGVSVELLRMPERSRNLHREEVAPGRLPLISICTTGIYVLRLALRLRSLRPQLVHTNSLKSALYGGAAAKLVRIPAVLHIRDRIADDYLPKSAVRPLRFAIQRLADAIVTDSDATKATLRPTSLGTMIGNFAIPRSTRTKAKPITSIPSPIATSIPSPIAAELRGGVDRLHNGLGVHMGMVGRLAPWKGQHVFLEAFANAFPSSGASASIIGAALFGEDEYEEDLMKQIDELGIGHRVSMKGFREDVTAELRDMDVLVHASVIPEPFGMVIIEAMAAGLPVLAPAAGGPLEIIDNGVNGLLYPPGDVEALTALMRTVAEDGELRRRLGEAARATATCYSPDAIAKRVMDVYREVLGSECSPDPAK